LGMASKEEKAESQDSDIHEERHALRPVCLGVRWRIVRATPSWEVQ